MQEKNAAQSPKVKNIENEIVKEIISFKNMTPAQRAEFLKTINPRGVAPKPPKIVLTEGANIDKLPPKLKAIFLRAKQDPEFLAAIMQELKRAIRVLVKHAQDHQTFCDNFVYPPDFAKRILKIFGMTEDELRKEMEKIGFFQGHRNYKEPFYLVLVLLYALGLYLNDKDLRIFSLMLISARYWNAIKKRQWPYGCDPDVARYVQNYILQNNSVYKKYKTPFLFLINHFIPSKDALLQNYVRQDVADPKNGMIKILTNIQPSLHSYIVGTFNDHYYEAYRKGLKETVEDAYQKAYDNNKEMIEARETLKNLIHQLLDKLDKNMAFDKNGLMDPLIVRALKAKFNIHESKIEQLNQWVKDNQEDIKMIAEFLLNGLEPKSEEEFCSINVAAILTNIGNAKKNEFFTKIKEYKNQITEQVFGNDKEKLGKQSWYRLQLFVLYAILLYIKKLICRKI